MTDRELSEAVAQALGWTEPPPRTSCTHCTWRVDAPWAEGFLPDQCSVRGCPRHWHGRSTAYATDTSAIPALIAWLNKHAHHVVITCYATGANIHDPIYVESMRIQASGKTLNEALCRLILAVDGAKKESKKP
jgi:hypothetical protein